MSEINFEKLEALSDLCTPWCLHTVGTLRIADHISRGINHIDDLAKATESNAYALLNVMRHLVSKGVFEETEPKQFGLNDVSRGLVESPYRPDLTGIFGRMAYAWGTLPTYVKTGESGYHEQFGLPFWEDLAANPDVGKSFDDLMGIAGHGVPDPHFPITGDWDSVKTVVDVGGGTGAMLAEILRARPHIHGTLVDLPGTAARSAEIFQAAGVSDRVTVSGQSFFDPLPAGADIYLLKKVIGNWPDKEKKEILRRCAEAARPSGRIVIMGGVTPDEESHHLSIEMVLVGGKPISLSEFREMAHEVGLKITSTWQHGGFLVECQPI
ncbi:methyltransferase [Lederbergia wuyishanensis]|uniref:SAM-dependent methyltransferase n=1 Tax=Lederbergia wuyishanensis TaxID=1347903 RepID=A0ABU0D3P3_9BACI|nr:methyltransferase [Lederbergia wuyishanensis]MCJ8007806.1 hypothetical protein [Lederbergia wuyishanensis]MDQ0343029.1 SAM-dependent methyltransferase [Lederbergia wuyishanensis]